jgi:UDP-N-acetylmuramoyl-tripeptide--D-alanyl-D-alanine ligase
MSAALRQSLADREKLQITNPADFWTLDRVASALSAGPREPLSGAWPRGARSLSGISTDTRAIGSNQLFVALIGENHDAHEFLAQAVAAGAAALVVSKPERTTGLNVPIFMVRDTTVALGKLANYWRRAWGGAPDRVVVGITGTNGKTGTKDLTAAALSSRLEVHATRGNLNNRIGVPLTLFALPDHAHAAIIEMGTSLPGEIGILRAIAEPDIAVVTSVAEGHLEGLGSIEGVLVEKTSIYDGPAVAVAPATQPEIAARARAVSRHVISAGLGEGDLAASRWNVEADGSGWMEVEGVRVDVPLRGIHSLRNAMLALAVASEAGISIADAARGIASLPPQSMRLELTRLGRDGQTVLINDAYNANPGSAVAAIEYLESLRGSGKKVLVLGGMRELGAMSPQLHDRVATRALQSSVDTIAGIGDFADAFGRVASGDARVITAPDVDELWPLLRGRMEPGAMILLKASRGVRLERIVPLIREWAER